MGNPEKVIWHPLDIEYFKEYQAPVMESIQKLHFTPINSTIPFFGPLFYFLLRDIGAEQVLEIGHAEGYSSHYLAHAVKDNGIRFQMPGNKYYGIDIVQTEKVRKDLEDEGLPVDIRNLDSMKLTPETFKDITFDVIFQDGCHDTEHVLYEIKTMYPQLKGNGRGYWIMHDALGPAEEGFHEIKKLCDAGVFQFEYVRIFSTYGLCIFRKMEGWDESKRYWPK